MTITFNAELELSKIKPHPKNPRHKAVADQEMVDSIKAVGLVEPVIVALDTAGDYWLLAGERRWDGCKKAKLKTVPALIRTDITTDDAVIEFAIVENFHRKNFTPIEEAEAFAELAELRDPSTRKNYTIPAIARKTGCSVETVRERLKLLKLSKKTKEQVHKGQLTIGDGLQLVALEADPKLQAEVAKQAGSSGFKHALESATRKLKAKQKVDQHAESLNAAGYPEFGADETFTDSYQLSSRYPAQVTVLNRDWTGGDLDEQLQRHADDNCLAYVRTTGGTYYSPCLLLVCKDRPKHLTAEEKESDAAKAERDAEHERRVAEATAKREAADVARTLRTTTVLQHIGPTLDGPVADSLRTLLPALVWDLDDEDSLTTYARLMDLGVVWKHYAYQRGDEDRELFEAHMAQITAGSTTYVAKALVAVLLARAEEHAGQFGPATHAPHYMLESTFDLRYLELLEGLGHDFCDVDEEIRANATPAAEDGAA